MADFPAPSSAVIRARDPLEPLGETVERPLRVGGGERGLEGGEPALDRAEPGDHRLGGGVAVGLQRREPLGEGGERPLVGAAVLDPPEPVAEGREPGLEPQAAVEPGLDQGLGIAGDELALDGAEPGDDRLDALVLAVVRRAISVGERRRRRLGACLGLQRRQLGPDVARTAELGPDGGGLAAQRLEAGLEPLQRLAPLGPAAVEEAEAGLERGEAGERRLEAGVAALLEARQPLAEVGDGAGEVGRGGAAAVEGGEARLGGGRGRRLRGLEPAEPLAEPVEERPRLGGLAHLLEGAQAGAELVEAGEGGLERGVLVADEAEELAGHRLQPLLGGRGLGGERLEPLAELGLVGGERLEALAGRARRPAAGRRHRHRRGRRRREPFPPLAEGEAEGAEGREARRPQSRHADTEGLHRASSCLCRKSPQSSPLRG